jgi:3-oxoadipate enol-lactonase
MEIKCNGISMHYQIEGKGPNIVLIHGAGNNLNMWYHQIPVLSKNYRVITYDIRGFGDSEGPLNRYSMSILVEDLFQLMKTINISEAIFLGFSMGARIALELATRHKQMVKALILANSGLGLVPPSQQSLELRHSILELLQKEEDVKAAELMSTYAFSPDFKERKPLEFERYLKFKLRNKPQGLARVMKGLDDSNEVPDVNQLKCPILLIAGEADFYVGQEQSKKVQERLLGSKLVLLPCGHTAAVELPSEFNCAVTKFLSSVEEGNI